MDIGFKPATREEVLRFKELELLERIDKKLSCLVQTKPIEPVLPQAVEPKAEQTKPKKPRTKKVK